MNYFDPNTHLSEDMISKGLKAAAGAFYHCRMEPRELPAEEYSGSRSLLYGEVGRHRFLVYVRMTVEDEVEDGTGSMPGLLIDAALRLRAEPHVIRVHMRRAGGGIGFQYFGYHEFVDLVQMCADWNDHLLGRRGFSGYRRLVGDRVSEFRIDLVRGSSESRRTLLLKLFVDGEQPYLGTICPFELLRSTRRGDECEIFTCSCGVAGCAGIFRGIRVAHEGDFTLWKAYHARKRRIFLFDRKHYRSEILGQCERAIRSYRAGEVDGISHFNGELHFLEKAYCDALEPHGAVADPGGINWIAAPDPAKIT